MDETSFLDDVQTTGRLAAHAGAGIVRHYFEHGVTMRAKESYNLVSDADVESEHAIAKIIREQFPTHEILGEEGHDADLSAEHLWIIDPLDGTNNFAHQIPHFAISVGYYHRGQAKYGIVINPIHNDTYEATLGRGSTHNGKSIRVGEQSRLDEVLIGVGFYYDRGQMMVATLDAIRTLFGHNIHGIRRMGTASLDLCQVACGMFGAYFEYKLSTWDFAAGRLILEEAGGKITTSDGSPLPLANSSILASNGHLHEAVLNCIRDPFLTI